MNLGIISCLWSCSFDETFSRHSLGASTELSGALVFGYCIVLGAFLDYCSSEKNLWYRRRFKFFRLILVFVPPSCILFLGVWYKLTCYGTSCAFYKRYLCHHEIYDFIYVVQLLIPVNSFTFFYRKG